LEECKPQVQLNKRREGRGDEKWSTDRERGQGPVA